MRMATKWNVVITDFEYPDIEIERSIIEPAGAVVHGYQCKDVNDVIAVVSQAHVVINQYAPITRRVIEHLPPFCKAIAQYGIGVDTIDVPAATERGIMVINVPSYCEDEVAEHALAMMLALARRLPFYDREVRRGVWDYTTQAPIRRLVGQTLGLIGFGKIARKVAQKASGLGLSIISYDPFIAPEIMQKFGVKAVSLDELLRTSDFVSIHVPLQAQTRHLLGERELRLMKKSAVLVNTSRGAIIDQEALYHALKDGTIRAAGLDVFYEEPPSDRFSGSDLLRLENVLLSPHVAWYSEESIVALRTQLAQDVVRVLMGKKPKGLVNSEVLSRQKGGAIE